MYGSRAALPAQQPACRRKDPLMSAPLPVLLPVPALMQACFAAGSGMALRCWRVMQSCARTSPSSWQPMALACAPGFLGSSIGMAKGGALILQQVMLEMSKQSA